MSARSSISRTNKIERQFYPKWVQDQAWYIENWNAAEGWNTTGFPGPMIVRRTGMFPRYDCSSALHNLAGAMSIARDWRSKHPVPCRLRNHCSGRTIMVI